MGVAVTGDLLPIKKKEFEAASGKDLRMNYNDFHSFMYAQKEKEVAKRDSKEGENVKVVKNANEDAMEYFEKKQEKQTEEKEKSAEEKEKSAEEEEKSTEEEEKSTEEKEKSRKEEKQMQDEKSTEDKAKDKDAESRSDHTLKLAEFQKLLRYFDKNRDKHISWDEIVAVTGDL